MQQTALFDELPPSPAALPPGLRYEPGFLSGDEEAALVELIRGLPLREALYKGYTARRRIVSYGGEFDYDTNRLLPGQPLIAGLLPLRERIARWAGLAPEALVHVLVAEYAPGTPLGWHRDVPDFEDVFGVSLGNEAELRLRPHAAGPPAAPRGAGLVKLALAPRSAYALQGPARWQWQHSVAPVAALRWSVTLRTARRPATGMRFATGRRELKP